MGRSQRGLTLIGFLIVLAIVLFVTFIGMKMVPAYLNHYELVSSMKSLAQEPGVANMSERRLRDLLTRKFIINYVEHVDVSDIELQRSSTLSLVADYEVRVDLIGNVDAVMSFRHVQALN